MPTKTPHKKLKKISISLNERETGLLQLYAKANGLTKGMALKRLMKSGLRDYEDQLAKGMPQNQLGLFDALQTDIFSLEED